MALPQLTDEQRKQALEKAAAARHARAELREQIKKGEKSLESVLNSDDPIASRMKVSTLIESLPGYGKAKAAKIMEELGISATRPWTRRVAEILSSSMILAALALP